MLSSLRELSAHFSSLWQVYRTLPMLVAISPITVVTHFVIYPVHSSLPIEFTLFEIAYIFEVLRGLFEAFELSLALEVSVSEITFEDFVFILEEPTVALRFTSFELSNPYTLLLNINHYAKPMRILDLLVDLSKEVLIIFIILSTLLPRGEIS